jgi:histidine kinase
MFSIAGYQISEVLYESSRSLVYRANRDRASVILKVLNQEYPSPEAIARFRSEFEITRSLDLAGVIQAYALEPYQHSLAMVLEDFGGESLSQYIRNTKLTLQNFLEIAIQLATILAQIHQQNVMHKDINPANIVINPVTGKVKIIDFGIATVLSRENPTVLNPDVLEGTLAYLSPEQTGRMNRSIDYRTDFYSLGVTFYQLLCNRVPFETQDAIELVHCHIAKQAIPPHEVNSEIPQVVSSIVMKLLEKAAEDRYQSTWGLQADLQICLDQLQENGKIFYFSIGDQDVIDRLQISQKLYGREKEIALLLEAYDRTLQGHCEVVFISGYAGVGKTAIVQEIYKPNTGQRGYFISGKSNQFQQNAPYSSLTQAFRVLVRQLLAETEDQITNWRDKLFTALGNNLQIILDVIPELKLIVGKKLTEPAALDLPAAESQNRFNLTFQNFIRVFAQSEHPLVLFLDDLQWADRSSLKLIQMLVNTPEIGHFLVIGAYRDNEVNATHPLRTITNELSSIRQISLSPLALTAVNQLLIDTLKCSPEKALLLSELVLQKTDGNPFFINEFLKSLYQEGLLNFNYQSHQWEWNLDHIQRARLTDNALELMVSNIQKLSQAGQQVLKLAACIGREFDLKTLAIVNEKSQSETATELWEAAQQNFILPVGDSYKYIQNPEQEIYYQFLHDRIQQAAYSLLPDEEKKRIHLKIGQLLSSTSKVFDTVNQLNLGRELLTKQAQKDQLARLNFLAGKKAQGAVAYEAAFQYLTIAQEQLDQDSWSQAYDFTLSLYTAIAEAAYLNGNFEKMEQFAEIVMQQAKTLLEKVKIYKIKIQACIAQNRLWDAISTALEVLTLLGVQLPEHPSQLDLQTGFTQAKSALAEKQLEELLNLPPMTDPHKLAAMQIIASVCTPTYFIAQSLWELMVFQKIQLSLKYGNAPGSAFGYADYGMVLCSAENNVELGYQFAQLASHLLEKLNTREFLPKTLLLINMYLKHWKEHLRETLEPLLEAYRCGLETGDLEYATFAIAYRFYHSYLVGRELSELKQEITSYIPAIAQFNQELPLSLSQIYQQAILTLIDNSGCLKEADYSDQYTQFHLYLNKLILSYLFGDYPQAEENANMLHQLLDKGAIGMLIVPAFYFYDSLAKIAVADHILVISNQAKLKHWADHAPMNYLHKFYLVEAERYRALGEELEAMKLYDSAIALANEHGYIQEEALANELTAKFYLERGNPKIAKVYLLEARYCYQQWGAKAKVKHLESQYPEFLNRLSNRETTQNTITTVGTTGSEALDLATVIKASQTLSGEIVLDQLLEKLIKILLENAGAADGFLILETQNKLFIEAEGHLDQITVLQSTPIEQSDRLSAAIVHYVARTQESVVLNDAILESRFSQDPYISQHQPKSVLCTPLLHQGKLSGILYIENNLTTNAFTTERLEILQLLSTQAAIALENARLYNQLEIRVQERTLELTQANQQLEELTLELQRSNTELEQFAYIASHDLQEPLRAITSYTQMLANRYQGKLDEKADTYIGFVVDGATRMQHLIKDLLAYSRAGRQALKRRPTDCNLVLQKVLIDLQVAIAENQARITFDPLPTIEVDSNQLAQVFQNFISNSIKYRREENPRIHINAISTHQNWLFSFTDNGIGIEPEYCDRIFGIFQRLHTSDEYEGTGLGLAISKRIVERHHGQIWVESTLNQGSTFYIELPSVPKTLGAMQ